MIRTQGLRYQYPKGPQLAFADVDVPQGATLVLRGNSGSGKSTWLALVAGLLTATAGALTVADAQPGALAQAARDAWRARTLGFLPQKLHLSDALTVAQNLNLVYFAAGLPVDAAAVAQALAALDVADLAARKPSQLSGGQAQRVAIARALIASPDMLVCDEPVSALDLALRAQVLQLLMELRRARPLALLLVTHDLHTARLLCERMLVLRQGLVVEQGPAAELFARPTADYTRSLLDAMLSVDPARAGSGST